MDTNGRLGTAMNLIGDRGRAMNRVGWAIALAGACLLGVLAVAGATERGPDRVCMAGYYQSGSWCVDEDSPSQPPGGDEGQVLVAFHPVTPSPDRGTTRA